MKYEELVELYEAMDSTTKRLEKTSLLADFLKMVGDQDPKILPVVTLLSLGRIFPTWSEEELGIGSKLLMKAISLVVGVGVDEVEDQMRDSGDIGSAAQELFKRKVQSTLFRRSSPSVRFIRIWLKLQISAAADHSTRKWKY